MAAGKPTPTIAAAPTPTSWTDRTDNHQRRERLDGRPERSVVIALPLTELVVDFFPNKAPAPTAQPTASLVRASLSANLLKRRSAHERDVVISPGKGRSLRLMRRAGRRGAVQRKNGREDGAKH